MKAHLEELIDQSIQYLKQDEFLPADLKPEIILERTRNPEHGDYACNIAMMLAKPLGMAPREIAEAIINRLPDSCHVEKADVAGPGFINLFIKRTSQLNVVRDVLRNGDEYGHQELDHEKRLTVEFVSANPTGPLHVGHGRGAAYGASLASILKAAGYTVQREYYVNDNGRQMDILAVSVWIRYLELCGEPVRFPNNGYQGDYIYDIARTVRNDHGDKLRFLAREVELDLPLDGSQVPEAKVSDPDDAQKRKIKAAKERHIDALTERARSMLGDAGFDVFFEEALASILNDIRDDLNEFGVRFDLWFSERELEQSGAIERAIDKLDAGGYLYKKDGAIWFKASELGDEKDRVIVRENGRKTYFASDIAYFLNKLERNFDQSIYVFGADHHGYIARLRAAAIGLGEDPSRLQILLVQFAVLYRFGEKVQMSTRSGKYVSLRDLRDEVGSDAARFFYVMRSHDQHLDFDLDLAKSRDKENPVYYIQYAHARIHKVFQRLEEEDLRHNSAIGESALELLNEKHEQALTTLLGTYPEIIELAARKRSPHMLAHYLQELAQALHAYYHEHKVIVDDENLRNARLNLLAATGQVLRNGLTLLGVSAPEEM